MDVKKKQINTYETSILTKQWTKPTSRRSRLVDEHFVEASYSGIIYKMSFQLINIKAVMINDINYLILTLTRENKEDIANILIKVESSLEVNIRLHCHCLRQDASKLHLVPSRHQRPLLYKPDLKTQAVWPLAELRALNRWTNKQSITGL